MGIGFLENVKVERPDVERDEDLDKWIEFLEDLCKDAEENFKNISNLNDKESKIKNAKEGNEIHSNIVMIREYIGKYMALKRINLEEYFRKYYSHYKYTLAVFNQKEENKDDKETR